MFGNSTVAQQKQSIEQFITPALKALGFDIVRIQMSGTKRKILQVMIERTDLSPVLMADCVQVSREISVLMDVEDPIEGAYNLEVTSPGINRPLVKAADYKRFIGEKALVQIQFAIDGQRKFTGIIVDADDENCSLDVCADGHEPQRIRLAIADITQARLEPDIDFKSLTTNKANKGKKV